MQKPKIKICGITNFEDADLCAKLGADFLGFINYEKSPRFINIQNTSKIISKISKNIQKVGVFVNKELNELLKIIDENIFDVLQLHGDEDEKYIEEIKRYSNIEIWKAIKISPHFIRRNDKTQKLDVDKYLLDNFDGKNFGGTGKSFDWEILNQIKIPREKIILSGGIGLENVAKAMSLDVFAIDVNSKIEKKPGKKDARKIKELFQILC